MQRSERAQEAHERGRLDGGIHRLTVERAACRPRLCGNPTVQWGGFVNLHDAPRPCRLPEGHEGFVLDCAWVPEERIPWERYR